MACHFGIVVMVRTLTLRVGVSAWTATILAGMLAVFGSGWENIVFAIQIVYNLSLLAFLVQLWLLDHDGQPDRRDVLAGVAGLVAVASSGFGPFFMLGAVLFAVIRRRWRAAAVATLPSIVVSHGGGWRGVVTPRARTLVDRLARCRRYVNRGISAVFQGMTSTASLVGVALLATIAVLLWRHRDPAAHDVMVTLAVTATSIYVGLGIQRGGFGLETAANSRYVYIGAALLMPAFGVAVDQLGPPRPAGDLGGASHADRSAGHERQLAAHQRQTNGHRAPPSERALLDLVAGDPRSATVDQSVAPLVEFSPDVRLGDLPELVSRRRDRASAGQSRRRNRLRSRAR